MDWIYISTQYYTYHPIYNKIIMSRQNDLLILIINLNVSFTRSTHSFAKWECLHSLIVDVYIVSRGMVWLQGLYIL